MEFLFKNDIHRLLCYHFSVCYLFFWPQPYSTIIWSTQILFFRKVCAHLHRLNWWKVINIWNYFERVKSTLKMSDQASSSYNIARNRVSKFNKISSLIIIFDINWLSFIYIEYRSKLIMFYSEIQKFIGSIAATLNTASIDWKKENTLLGNCISSCNIVLEKIYVFHFL